MSQSVPDLEPVFGKLFSAAWVVRLGFCELAVVQLFDGQGAGWEEGIAHQHGRDGRVFIPGHRARHSHHVQEAAARLARAAGEQGKSPHLLDTSGFHVRYPVLPEVLAASCRRERAYFPGERLCSLEGAVPKSFQIGEAEECLEQCEPDVRDPGVASGCPGPIRSKGAAHPPDGCCEHALGPCCYEPLPEQRHMAHACACQIDMAASALRHSHVREIQASCAKGLPAQTGGGSSCRGS